MLWCLRPCFYLQEHKNKSWCTHKASYISNSTLKPGEVGKYAEGRRAFGGKFLTQREEIFEFAAERQEGKKEGRRRREKKGRVRKLQDGSLEL